LKKTKECSDCEIAKKPSRQTTSQKKIEQLLRLFEGHPSPQLLNIPYGVAQVSCFSIEIIVQ
jgi:hypothetical protein